MVKKIFKIWSMVLLYTLALVMLSAAGGIIVANVNVMAKTENQGKAGKNATWTYDETKKVLTISGKGSVDIGNLQQIDENGEGIWLGREDGSIPVIQKIVFEEGISTIDYQFFGLENVETISLPKSFKKIQYYSGSIRRGISGQSNAWSTSLKKITVHKKNKRFKSSNGVLLSKNGKILYAFPAGKTVDTYKISKEVTKIEKYAFWRADIGKITIGNKVTKIGQYAFSKSAIKEVVFGKSVKRIGRSAFQDCSLSQLKLPESLTYIDSYAFYACPLTELTIPSKVTKILPNAFSKNHKLKKIVIQGNTEISTKAFLSTVDYWARNKDNVNVHYEQPITVVLGKNMKTDVKGLCKNLGNYITFRVKSGNPKYYVKNGNLYTVKGNKLIYKPKKDAEATKTSSANAATGSTVQI